MVVCPSCGGAKAGFGVMCSDRGCRTGAIPGGFCKGEGEVSSDAAERWHEGEAMRRERVEEGLTLFQKATILGVDPILLNDIEHGRRSAEELNNR